MPECDHPHAPIRFLDDARPAAPSSRGVASAHAPNGAPHAGSILTAPEIRNRGSRRGVLMHFGRRRP